jgi:DNA polymerase-3 subunit delta'
VLYQDVAQDRLGRALSSRRVPHAYLFTGPAGVGKEMLATRLAQLLLCGRREASDEGGLFAAPTNAATSTLTDACGECQDCILFAAGTHPDYHRIHRMLAKMHPEKKVRDRKATILSVDVIRQFVIGQIGLCASRGRAKVFVIVESERMNDEAQNALLKTLEEPPGHSYIILLATAPDELLPTTRSRCQQIAFGTLPDSFIAKQLVARRGVSAEAAAFLTQLAQGSLGQALRYAEMGMFDRLGVVAAAMRTAPDDPLACGKSLADLAKSLSADAEDVQLDCFAGFLCVIFVAMSRRNRVDQIENGFQSCLARLFHSPVPVRRIVPRV